MIIWDTKLEKKTIAPEEETITLDDLRRAMDLIKADNPDIIIYPYQMAAMYFKLYTRSMGKTLSYTT